MTAEPPDVVSTASPPRLLRLVRAVALIAVAAALAAGLAAGLSGPLYRAGLLALQQAFAVLQYGAEIGGGAALVALAAGLWAALATGNRRLLVLIAAAAIVGGLGFYIPYSYRYPGTPIPPIHDISTDTEDVPAFVAVLPLREGARNPVAYGGPEIAAQQHEAYPDLKPVALAMPPEAAQQKALSAARQLRWVLVASEPAEGRIEATATTFWYGFKDDIVIRLKPAGGGTLMDVRSLSRIGRGDAGANAFRIRKFIALMTADS